MTDSEINIAIAEWCGWSKIENKHTMSPMGNWVGYPPQNAIIGNRKSIPDYCYDLNACIEFESRLLLSSDCSWFDYKQHLIEVCQDTDGNDPITASAYQRCKAFMILQKKRLESIPKSFKDSLKEFNEGKIVPFVEPSH